MSRALLRLRGRWSAVWLSLRIEAYRLRVRLVVYWLAYWPETVSSLLIVTALAIMLAHLLGGA